MRFVAAVAVMLFFLSLPAREEIVFWYQGAAPKYQQVLRRQLQDKFNQQQSAYRLTIEFRAGLDGLQKDISIALAARQGPDVVLTAGPAYMAKFVAANHLAPLDKYARKYRWQERILEPIYKIGMINGQLYSVAKTIESLGLFYNQDVFTAQGWDVPQTRDEWYRILDQAVAKGMIAVIIGNQGWQPSNEHYYTSYLNAVAGPAYLYQVLSGQASWDSPPIRESFEELQTLFSQGYADIGKYFSINGEAQIKSVLSGAAAFTLTGTWAFQWVPETEVDKIGFIPLPGLSSRQADPVFPIGVGATLSINNYSQHPDGAAAVLDFMLSDSFYQEMNYLWPGEWSLPLKNLPPPKMETPHLAAMRKITAGLLQGGFGFTSWTFFPPKTNQALIKGVERVWLEQQTLDKFLSQVQRTFKREQQRDDLPTLIKP